MTTAAATSRPRRRPLNRRATLLASAALLIAVPAWLSLVFSSPSFFLLLLPWPRHRLSPSHTPPSSSHFPPPDALRLLSEPRNTPPLSLRHLVFGIASSPRVWPRRSQYVRLWWRPADMRGHVWMDGPNLSSSPSSSPPPSLPPIRLSEDISRFRYTNPTGHPSGLRIARVVAETFRLAHRDARWFVLCDDDTVVSPGNLVAVLEKYDWREMVYVGGSSESHSANTYFSHSMAFGGGGIAVSYPLAWALAEVQDRCLERYPELYGSDDRLHACVSELGVPLTREHGFHQWDIRGSPHGLLAAHPIAPFVSIHHVEAVNPIYPGLSSLESLGLFTKAMKVEALSFLQRSICYDRKLKLTFSVSMGYVVQVFPGIVLPHELERSEQTYVAWNWQGNKDDFDFDTTEANRPLCRKPILFFLRDVKKDGNVTTSSYMRAREKDETKRRIFCFPWSLSLHDVKEIKVLGNPLSDNWHLVPRRLCCKVHQTNNRILGLKVGQCKKLTLGSVVDSL